MGIIQKQALQTTIVSFLGIGIGTMSQLLMPFIFEDEAQIGALALLNSVSRIFAIFFALGFTQITLQVFSNFRNEENGHSGYFMFAILYSIVGAILGLLSYYLFHDYFIGVGEEYKLIRSISFLIVPIIFFRIFYANLDVYLRMLFSSVIGAFLEGTILKLIILIGIVLFWLTWIDFTYMAYAYTIALSLPGFILIIFAFFKTKKIRMPDKRHFLKEDRKKLWSFGLFGIMASASGVIIVSIDQVMINNMMGTAAVGIYSVLFFAGVMVSVPSRGIKRIAVPVLAESWKKEDFENIETVYEKSVTNQTVIGIYLFIVGWLCIEPALTFLPKYADGIYVFFFIGVAQLFDMMTGVNMEIIATSERYRLNTYFNVVLAILVFGFNYFFISEWGIVGAASASALAMFIVNTARWYYLKRKFNLQPFTLKTLALVLIGIVMVFAFKAIVPPVGPIWLMLFYSFIMTVVYWGVVLKFNLAPDMTQWLLKIKRRFLG